MTEMIHKEDLDAVDICTPPRTHSGLAIGAMETGVHALVEKTMALHLSDCGQMIHMSHQTGVKLCIIHNELFRPLTL